MPEGARREGRIARILGSRGRQGDDTSAIALRAQLIHRGIARQSRQFHVDQQHLGRIGANALDGLRDIGDDFHVETQIRQQQGQQAATVNCPACGKPNAAGIKFCGECGGKMEVPSAAGAATVACVKCGTGLREGAKFCNECGASQEKQKCANCQNELNAGAKFCNECGTKVESA